MAHAHTIKPGDKVDLRALPTKADGGLTEDEGKARAEAAAKELGDLQETLFAAGQTGLLIVLQGRDTSGKDGTIRWLLRSMNAQSTRIAPFKVPTPKELSHDFLWRVHAQTPGRGETVVFNRSHYEDVLVVRVHELAPKEVWHRRYDHINAFERLLMDEGTVVVKFFLHISKEEQEQRLLAREEDTAKAWKLSVGDWRERQYWDAYTDAYDAALERCSTADAPWHVIPADHKWYRNLVITETLRDRLSPLAAGWEASLRELGERAKAEIAAFRAGQS